VGGRRKREVGGWRLGGRVGKGVRGGQVGTRGLKVERRRHKVGSDRVRASSCDHNTRKMITCKRD
jgi:hypothetical protein